MNIRAVRSVAIIFLVLFFASCGAPVPEPAEDARWRCRLSSPGGSLPFLMDWSGGDLATIYNGEESLTVTIQQDGNEFVIDFPHYDSRIRMQLSQDDDQLEGRWTRTSGPDKRTEMDFSAVRGDKNIRRFKGVDKNSLQVMDFSGNWLVQFESESSPSIATFEQQDDGTLTGTFRTTKGDYRFLAGRAEYSQLRLSVFDGAHAFLFKATADDDNSISGDFWSRDTWHETWTATRTDDVDLGDPFESTLR